MLKGVKNRKDRYLNLDYFPVDTEGIAAGLFESKIEGKNKIRIRRCQGAKAEI